MNTPFLLITFLFVIISVSMILIILVQRPQGGGLAGAFGGAGGGGSETVFGGRVGDALTWATVVGFVLYLGTAVALNKLESESPSPTAVDPTELRLEDQTPIPGPVQLPAEADPRGVPTPVPTEPPPGFGGIPADPPASDPPAEPE